MTAPNSLIGVGVPAEQAKRLGTDVGSKTGVGTALSGGTAITNNYTILTTSSGQTAFVLPAAPIGATFEVFNTSATTALIFPQSGETIDNGSASASVNVAQNKSRRFTKITSTGWASLLGA